MKQGLDRTIGYLLKRLVALGAFALLAAGPLAAEPGATVALDVGPLGRAPVSVTEYFSVLEDPTGELGLQDVQKYEVAVGFRRGQAAAEALNFGVTKSAYWLRLQLSNTSDQAVERMLEIAFPRLADIQFHQPNATQGYQSSFTGYARAFSLRPYRHRFYVFPVSMAAQSNQVVYLRVMTPNTMEIPVRLWVRSAFHEHERTDYMLQAGYFGIVLAMLTFNFLLFIAMRDVNYLLYVLFVGTTAFTIIAMNGMGIQFLWGNSPVWSKIATLFCASLSLIGLMLFMRRMIATAVHVPRLDRLLQWLVGVQVLVAIGLAVAFEHVIKLAIVVDVVTAPLILMTAIACVIKKQRSALFFLIAFGVLCIAVTMTALRALGVLPTNAITTDGAQYGSAIEMLLLAFALADHFNVLRKEKEQAQGAALRAEHQMVENLKSSERMLEGRVTERTAELSATIERLRQTQDELVQAEKLASLGSLVAGVAHELNTPIGNALTTASGLQGRVDELAAVVASGQLRRTTLEDFIVDGRGMAELVTRSCQRAANLIISFKQVAVDQTGEDRRVFDLFSVVEYNIAALRPSLGSGQWVIGTDIPADIRCDSYPGPLGQVIASLVENAVIHGFKGRNHGIVRISATVADGCVEMRFDDTGEGMEPAVLNRIFEPFFTTQLGKGRSGLGLSISRNIVTGVLGGSIQAISEPKRGSCFVLTFPLSAPHGADAKASSA